MSIERPETWTASRARWLVAGAAVVLYLASVGFGFTLDDPAVALENPAVRCGEVGRLFSTPYHFGPRQRAETGLYRPLTTLSFAANHALHGPRPSGFHAANVLLHAASSLLVLEVALAIGLALPGSLLAALLFAAHPVHVEAVASVCGRADLLATALFLLALLAWVRLRRADGAPSTAGIGSAAALSLLAMLSKEHAAAFVAVAAAWEILRPWGAAPGTAARSGRRGALLSVAALVLPLAAYLGLRVAALGRLLPGPGSVTPIENPLSTLGVLARLPSAVAVAGRYALLFVFPRTLSPDYSFAEIEPVASPLDPYLHAGIAALLLAAAAVALARQRAPLLAFAALLAILTFFPVSNVAVPIGTVMAERLLYLPSAGLCLAAGLLWTPIARRLGDRGALALLGAVLLVASARTVTASAAWRDDLSLASHAAAASPRSVKSLGNLSIEMAVRGRTDEALDLLGRALALAPDFWPNRINLSGVLLASGDLDGAEAQIARVLAADPANPSALLQRSLVLEKRGDVLGAEEAARAAAEAAPWLPEARLRLAALLAALGRSEEAEAEREAAREPECGK